MAYDEALADRLRDLLAEVTCVSEKRMFGGLAFLVDRHMAVVASGQGGLRARIDPADAEDVLADPDAELAVMRGKEMRGWARTPSTAVATDDALQAWIDRSLDYVRTLPPKG